MELPVGEYTNMSFFPNASIGITGSPFPIYSTLVGGSDGTNLRSLLTDATGLLKENMTQWASTCLGVPTTFGTTPGAVIAGSVNASLFSGTTAITQTAGALNVNVTSTTITGTVAVTQSTTPWVDNLTQVAGVVLGATAVTAFGTAPAAANVPGVNASLFSGTTALTNTA